MLKKIALGLLVLVLGLVGFVATRPAEFHIERSQTIDAPAYVVFNIVNNFKRWPTWSPWEKLDPGMQKTHSGAETGVGSVYEWSGNDDVGTGKMTIIESNPEQSVVIDLEFLKPFEARNTTRFTLTPAAKGVDVTWSMDGKNNFMAKAAGLFMDMDQMVGKDFEAGLATLGTIAAAEAREIEKAKSLTQKKEDVNPEPAGDAP